GDVYPPELTSRAEPDRASIGRPKEVIGRPATARQRPSSQFVQRPHQDWPFRRWLKSDPSAIWRKSRQWIPARTLGQRDLKQQATFFGRHFAEVEDIRGHERK